MLQWKSKVNIKWHKHGSDPGILYHASMYVYVCICMYMYVYVCICMIMYDYVSLCMIMYVCLYVCLAVCLSVYV